MTIVHSILSEPKTIAKAVLGDELKLPPDYWRFRLAQYILREERVEYLPSFLRHYYCPLFWLTNLFVLILPLYALGHGIVCVIGYLGGAILTVLDKFFTAKKEKAREQRIANSQAQRELAEAKWAAERTDPRKWPFIDLQHSKSYDGALWQEFKEVFGGKAEEHFNEIKNEIERRHRAARLQEKKLMRELEEARKLKQQRVLKIVRIAKPTSQALLILLGLAIVGFVGWYGIPLLLKGLYYAGIGIGGFAKFMFDACWNHAATIGIVIGMITGGVLGLTGVIKGGRAFGKTAFADKLFEAIGTSCAWTFNKIMSGISFVANFIKMFYLNNCPAISIEDNKQAKSCE